MLRALCLMRDLIKDATEISVGPPRAFPCEVAGEGPGVVHLGAESCFPFAGRQSDLYSAGSQAGGATIRVREIKAKVEGPECTILDASTHNKQPVRIALSGYSKEGHRLTFRLEQPPKKVGYPKHHQDEGEAPDAREVSGAPLAKGD